MASLIKLFWKHHWKWSNWERRKRGGGGISGRYFLPRHELLRNSRGNFLASTFNSFHTWNIGGGDVNLPEKLGILLPRRGPICVPIFICIIVRHHLFLYQIFSSFSFSVLLLFNCVSFFSFFKYIPPLTKKSIETILPLGLYWKNFGGIFKKN